MHISRQEAADISLANNLFLSQVEDESEITIARCSPDSTAELSIDLSTDGYLCFTPMFSSLRRKNRHSKSRSEQFSLFFPSYIFTNDSSFLNDFRGRVRHLKFGDHFASIKAKELISFNTVVVRSSSKVNNLSSGDSVRIVSGSMAGYVGAVLKVSDFSVEVSFSGFFFKKVNVPLDSVQKVC